MTGKLLKPRGTFLEHGVLKLVYAANGQRRTKRISVAQNIQWKRWFRQGKQALTALEASQG